MRRREREDAIAWKRRGRVKWLSMGDAPSRYFFAQVKPIQKRETLRCVRMDPNKVVLEEVGIMEEVHSFFNELYTHDEEISRNG